MAKRSNKKPDLHFSSSGTLEGFTSAGVQGFNELNPAAIVRELIQNSLDAVREDRRSKAVVRFEMEEIALSEVPAIDAYRRVLKKAEQGQSRIQKDNCLPDQAAMVVEAIKNCLSKKKIKVLFILDNGMGLDKQRMTGLLADGYSAKSSAGAGAVGNGHLTAIPASDLRYVLYGGVCAGGKQIASGHAILASFSEKGTLMGKDGYYALAVKGSMDAPYDFPIEKQIDPLIKEKLDWIESEYKKGAAVIIPGFNQFREQGIDLWDVVKRASACSFFAAIADGHLEVVYQDGGGEKKLHKSNIEEVFEGGIASEKRAKKFLSGNRAAGAYRTLKEGEKHVIDVECGRVEAIIREINDGKSRIDLCRNGMWISDNLPHLNISKFNDRKPFHCLIKVTAKDGEIHRLIRKSEGPLHNHIEAQKWLSGEDLRRLKNAFGKISEFLSSRLEKLQDKEFSIDDILSINAGRFEKWERLRPPSSRVPSGDERGGAGRGDGGGEGGDGDSDGGSNSFKRSGNSILFGAVPVPTGARSYSVELHPQEELKNDAEAEIRFILDENIDETCDPTNDEQYVGLRSVKMNQEEVEEENLIRSDKAVLGVRLGQFKPGEKHILSFDYDLPDDVIVPREDKIVLRAEIVRRRSRS